MTKPTADEIQLLAEKLCQDYGMSFVPGYLVTIVDVGLYEVCYDQATEILTEKDANDAKTDAD